MTLPDLINGCFEAGAGLFQCMNCWRIVKDKGYAGIWLPAWFLFTAWGFWNLYYYPHLNQWLSFSGGCLIVAANTVWITLGLYYGPVKREPGGPADVSDA